MKRLRCSINHRLKSTLLRIVGRGNLDVARGEMIAVRSKLSATGASEKSVDEIKTGATGDDEVAGSFDYAVAVNRWSMRLLGLWPLDTRISHLRCSVNLGVVIAVVFPAVAYIFMITDRVAIMNQVNMTFPTSTTLLRFIVMKMEAKNLRAVLRSMSRDWANYRYLSPRNRRIMFHYAKRSRRINMVYIAWLVITIGGEGNYNALLNFDRVLGD